jgi:hypothetical protein
VTSFALALVLAATVRGPADVEALTASADSVVHGRVLAKEGRFGKGGGLIFTHATVQPLEWWKGAASPDPIVVRSDGGEVGDLAQTVDGVATLEPGEEVVLFLRHIAGRTYDVERLALGKFAVGAVASGRFRAVRDRTRIACAGCASGEEDDLLLDELRERVRRAAARGAR